MEFLRDQEQIAVLVSINYYYYIIITTLSYMYDAL